MRFPGPVQQVLTGDDDDDRGAVRARLTLHVGEETPARPLPDRQVDDEERRLECSDLVEGVGHEGGRRDVVMLLLEHLPDDVKDFAGMVDGEDVLAPPLVALVLGLDHTRAPSAARASRCPTDGTILGARTGGKSRGDHDA